VVIAPTSLHVVDAVERVAVAVGRGVEEGAGEGLASRGLGDGVGGVSVGAGVGVGDAASDDAPRGGVGDAVWVPSGSDNEGDPVCGVDTGLPEQAARTAAINRVTP
jgi:hypothetical protein